MRNLISELKRRNVFRVAIFYIVSGWLFLQIADLLFEVLLVPDWTLRFLFGVLLVAFPFVLFLAWAYELTPEGIKKEQEVDRSDSITHHTGRKLDYLTIGLILLGLGFVLADRFVLEPRSIAEPPSADFEGDPAASQTVPGETATGGETSEAGHASIAVLPFSDLSPEGDQEYFADGISEELLNVLVRVDGLFVASRTSSFAYKDDSKNLIEIAEELEVDHILEGSVRKAGNRVRITAQLIDTETDRHLWSETFDRELTDIFAIQDEIATAVVAALKDALGIEKAGELVEVNPATTNLSAYDLYLEGRELFLQRGQKLHRSIEALEEAVRIDANFARAWEVLASALAVSSSWLGGTRDYYKDAEFAAKRAIELNPGLSQAYAVLAEIEFQAFSEVRDKDTPGIKKVFELLETAIANDPRNTTALLWKGIYLRDLGFLDGALASIDDCVEIDPGYQNCVRHRAYVLFSVDRRSEAAADFEAGLANGFVPWDTAAVRLLYEQGHRIAARLVTLAGENQPGSAFRPSQKAVDVWFDAIDNGPDPTTAKMLAPEYEAAKAGLRPEIFMNIWAPLFIDVGLYEELRGRSTILGYAWDSSRSAYRASSVFKQLMRDRGALDYWREVGFPTRCRPVGEDDFECD